LNGRYNDESEREPRQPLSIESDSRGSGVGWYALGGLISGLVLCWLITTLPSDRDKNSNTEQKDESGPDDCGPLDM
jgi:hypothetical protein